MDAELRALVRKRAGNRCEYCRLHQDREPFYHGFSMNEICADQTLTNQIRGLVEPCVVVDGIGNKLGLFCPEIDRSQYLGTEPSVNNEEPARRERTGGGRSLAEILADLNQRQ